MWPWRPDDPVDNGHPGASQRHSHICLQQPGRCAGNNMTKVPSPTQELRSHLRALLSLGTCGLESQLRLCWDGVPQGGEAVSDDKVPRRRLAGPESTSPPCTLHARAGAGWAPVLRKPGNTLFSGLNAQIP